MCQEHIGIALCAPTKKPILSFTCGDLHNIAKGRQVCNEAKGNCVCFFGTCGIIKRVMDPAGVDQANVPKVRCSACALREDNTGERRHGRDIIESPLLIRSAVSEEDFPSYMTTVRYFWDGDKCPFHQEAEEVKANGHTIEDTGAANGHTVENTDAANEHDTKMTAVASLRMALMDGHHQSDLPPEDSNPLVHSPSNNAGLVDGIKEESPDPNQTRNVGEVPIQNGHKTPEQSTTAKNNFLRLNSPARPPLAASPPGNASTSLAPNVGIGTSLWAPGGKLASEPAAPTTRSWTSASPATSSVRRGPSGSAHLTAAAKGFLRLN